MKTFLSILFLASLSYGIYLLVTVDNAQEKVWAWFSPAEENKAEGPEVLVSLQSLEEVKAIRKWTNVDGATITANLLSQDTNTVTLLKVDDQREYVIPKANLSSNDLNYLKSVGNFRKSIAETMDQLTQEFPPTLSKKYILTSGTLKIISVDETQVYNKYQRMFNSFELETLEDQIENAETWIERDMTKYMAEGQSRTSAGFQAQINYVWISESVKPHLAKYRDLL